MLKHRVGILGRVVPTTRSSHVVLSGPSRSRISPQFCLAQPTLSMQGIFESTRGLECTNILPTTLSSGSQRMRLHWKPVVTRQAAASIICVASFSGPVGAQQSGKFVRSATRSREVYYLFTFDVSSVHRLTTGPIFEPCSYPFVLASKPHDAANLRGDPKPSILTYQRPQGGRAGH